MSNWIFQANPERKYDVWTELKARNIRSWSITRHRQDLRRGDRAALWVSGRKDPGVYAVGVVDGDPFEDRATGRAWAEEDRGRLMTFCPLKLDWITSDEPIPRGELREDSRFAAARIITQPQAGNPFLTTDREWEAIEDRLPGRASRAIRNPNWAFDELILALDLYLQHGLLDDRDDRVVELSTLLNALPIHTTRPDLDRFRNPNGVALKLANFAALDPSYAGRGMSRGGRRDAEVWDRYRSRPEELAQIAAAIRTGVDDFPTVPAEDEDEVAEGGLLYRQHRARERNRTIIQRKRQDTLKRTGRLACEVCGFDFAATYGEVGDGYCEVHHLRPLAEGTRSTRLIDLAVLCANCHRMIHRSAPWPTVEKLRTSLAR